jgi:phosphosulfolactate phosphohydrolase-like enzyme
MTSQRRIYETIPETLGTYKLVGMANADAVERKCGLLANASGRTAVIVYDAFRCSSTILACFAAGVVGAFVMEKGLEGSGTSIAAAKKAANELGLDLEFGGELDGRPLSEGAVGNSPINAFRLPLSNKLLHFQSTNFGRVFVRLLRFLEPDPSSGLFVISYANCAASARYIQSSNYDRIIVACAGFYDCIALEDMVLGGKFIQSLGLAADHLDDDALAMLACYGTFGNNVNLVANTWTAKVLKRMGRYEDVADVLVGDRLPDGGLDRMASIVLKKEDFSGLAILRQIGAEPM